MNVITGSKRQRYVAVIVGISGVERYLLDDDEHETTELRRAARFSSERAAREAARERIEREHAVVRKHMGFRVEPIQNGLRSR